MHPEYCILSRLYLFNKPFRCLLGEIRGTSSSINSFRISPSQLLNPLGVGKAFFKVEKGLLSRHGFIGEIQKVCVPVADGGNVIVSTLSIEDAITAIKVLAERGNQMARSLVSNQVEPPYGVNIERRQLNMGTAITREKDVQHDLAVKLSGRTEVPTLDGSIDLLTDTEVIEVKCLDTWKCAIGQVLIYSDHYPSHAKRIHLFYPNPYCLVKPHHSERARLACQKRGIRFTADWMA